MKKLLAVLMCVPVMAHAEFLDGNRLLALMNGTTSDKIQAIGYVQGVFDAYSSLLICAPATITAGQVNDMIKNYLTNSPAIRHHTADTIVGEALGKVWPCEKKGMSL